MLPSTSTSGNAKGWFILHFEDPLVSVSHDILYMNDPAESLTVACFCFASTILHRFDRVSDEDVRCLTVHHPDTPDLQITMLQLLTFLRELPASPGATKPNLWGFAGNSIVVKFG